MKYCLLIKQESKTQREFVFKRIAKINMQIPSSRSPFVRRTVIIISPKVAVILSKFTGIFWFPFQLIGAFLALRAYSTFVQRNTEHFLKENFNLALGIHKIMFMNVNFVLLSAQNLRFLKASLIKLYIEITKQNMYSPF